MGTNETNLHRAARKLQRVSELSYQQARQRILAAKAAGRSTDPDVIAAQLKGAPGESALRQHLRSMHGVESFADDATEASLARYHFWDHDTGVSGPDHSHGPGDPLEGTLDDGERRCTECGDSFNLDEGGTDLSAETASDDGLCIRCEATVVDDERLAATQVVAVGHRYEDLSGANCAGAGTVIETNVDGNPNLVRLELDGGGTLRVDVRRFATEHLDDDIAAELIDAARTTEAGNLELLASMSLRAVAVADPDGGEWVIHCETGAGHANVAYVDGRVTDDQLEAWFVDRDTQLVVLYPDGSVDLDEYVAGGTHLSSCDDDGYCNFCGHQDNPDDEWTAQDERNERTDLCEMCKPLEHPTCPDDADCVCCAQTREQLADAT